jgi:hypothetical protein
MMRVLRDWRERGTLIGNQPSFKLCGAEAPTAAAQDYPGRDFTPK